jgi:HSP20 family protein
MAIQRIDPLRDLHRLQDRMNRMFEDALSQSAPGDHDTAGGSAWKPPTDLVEDEGGWTVRADLPGVDRGELELSVEHGRLTLRGERRRTEAAAYLRAERPEGRFNLQIELPAAVDRQRIEASHRNGVLEVFLPRRREDSPGRIAIRGE